LEYSIDYGAVCIDIVSALKSEVYNLIETAADRVCMTIMQNYPLVSRVVVEIKKPEAPIGLPIKYVSAVRERERHTAYIGVGSNIGDKSKNMRRAVDIISKRPDCEVLKVSDFLVTKPYGVTNQPDFLNACIKVSTLLEPLELLRALKGVEAKLGRVKAEKWGPRSIDLDILFYDRLVFSAPELTIPHADLHNRAFVLEPLCALEPSLIHPVRRKTVAGLLKALSKKKRQVKDSENDQKRAKENDPASGGG
jgi:dihydroneopterin aldolase/2-amino-4-hydroxy-6-hydroxymethyldihydropteridine diphosphokinase